MSKLLFFFIFLLSIVSSSRIYDEKVSIDELKIRLKAFNDFYHELNPNSKNLELRVDSDGDIRLHALKDLKAEEVFITFEKNHFITTSHIYSTKYGEVMEEIEEMYGYDDMTNLALSLIHEKFNPESKWKNYIDIFPIEPQNLVYNFWESKSWSEPILKGTTAISNFFIKDMPWNTKCTLRISAMVFLIRLLRDTQTILIKSILVVII